MGILDISNITTRFVVAEMEYVSLIEKAVDFESKGGTRISAEELRAVREAKKKRDALEKEMLTVWEASELYASADGRRR